MPRTSSCFDGVARTGNLGAAVRFTPEVPLEQAHWEVCPPLRRPPPNAPDLINLRFGRLTVVGLHALLSGRWVVRCSCGDFEVRRARAIGAANPTDRCIHCQKLRILKRRAHFEQYGTWPAESDSY